MSQVFISGVLTEVGQGADEIISLRRQLAEKDAEIERINSSPTIEACRQMIRDKAVIEASMLNEQLAESQARFKQLEKQLWYEQNISFRNQLNETQRRLEESQAREVKLRDVVKKMGHCDCGLVDSDNVKHSIGCNYRVSKQALALPTDNTALREMIAEAKSEQSNFDNHLFMEERKRLVAKAGEVMRERALDKACGWIGIDDEIRALPGVTLENLQG